MNLHSIAWLAILWAGFPLLGKSNPLVAHDARQVIIVQGAGGEDTYAEMFLGWSQRWKEIADKAGTHSVVIGGDSNTNDREMLQAAIETAVKENPSELWIVLIGHGTFDGSAKFNLRGPDFTAQELADWLKPRTDTTVVINCASASAPFIEQISGPGRIVVTATKSGAQYNFARFGSTCRRRLAINSST